MNFEFWISFIIFFINPNLGGLFRDSIRRGVGVKLLPSLKLVRITLET